MQSSRYRVSSSNGPLYADCSSSQRPNPVDVGVALSTNLGLLALRDPPSPDRHGTEPSEKPACDDFQRRQWRAEGELRAARSLRGQLDVLGGGFEVGVGDGRVGGPPHVADPEDAALEAADPAAQPQAVLTPEPPQVVV